MAALDFPNSPTVGDAFVAGNGVRYTWNGITWFAADPGATGDFMAVATTSTAITGTNAPFIFPTVVAGNASGAYSVSTGRYTPPAGRYFLSACIGLSNAGTVGCQIRKNGVAPGIANSTTTSPSWAQVQADCIADANGSDYFDVWTYSTTGVASTDKHWFLAYPISGIKGPPGDPTPGTLLQTQSFQTGAMATGAVIIPNDDTIPQITEGVEFMTLAITPRSATSKLVIEVIANVSTGTITTMTVALFQDSTANALAAVQAYEAVATAMHPMSLRHTMTSGTTSATTFRVRAGLGVAGNLTFNGGSGLRQMGGVMASSIVIQEVAP